MIIHAHFKRPKEKKKPGWQKAKAEYDAWLKSHGHTSKKKTQSFQTYVPELDVSQRKTPNYPSVSSYGGSATKPNLPKVYTGDKMIGIGTLHKSNAVPIFSDDDAKDQALMRR